MPRVKQWCTSRGKKKVKSIYYRKKKEVENGESIN
jgi:hypothetical protein